MKIRTVFYAFMSIMVLFAVSCQKEDNFLQNSTIEKATDFVEQNFSMVALPFYPEIFTKSVENNTITFLWDEAILTDTGGVEFVEVPLGGPRKLKSVYITSKSGNIVYSKAATKSYLVLEYREGSQVPEVYVETYIQKGRKCRMNKAYDFTKARGFAIVSDLDGNILSQKAFVNGNMIEIEDKVEGSCQCGENLFPNCDFVGFRACPVILVATKTRTGCPIYEYLTCPDCGAAYTGNIQDMELACPYCGYKYYSQYVEICPTCGGIRGACSCPNPAGSCAPCGRNAQNCDTGCGKDGGHCTCE